MIDKKNNSRILIFFLASHLILWTFIPYLSNINLPLDTIEALAWASDLQWGYDKHPPVSAMMVWLFYYFFGSNDWAYYFLSQIFVTISFFFVWKLSYEFFLNKILAFLSIFVLEGIVFFNYTTPEFNVYVCQLPFKAILAYVFWKCINENKLLNWIILGFSSALGFLSHYSFMYLIISMFFYFIFFHNKNRKIINHFFVSLIVFLVMVAPHLYWLYQNDYITIKYALNRTGVSRKIFLDHVINPLVFLIKQSGMILIFGLMVSSLISFKKKKLKLFKFDKKKIFLFFVVIVPLIFVFLTSLITGAKIRTMWMSTFYVHIGLFFIYFLKEKLDLKKIKSFYFLFIFIFFLSPATYLYVSLSNDFKRTDYPGKEISMLVQKRWNDNFTNDIRLVIGDEWSAGNLSYHLETRPVWTNDLNKKILSFKKNQGVIYTGNPKVLKKICPGVFGEIKPVGYCMIGKR